MPALESTQRTGPGRNTTHEPDDHIPSAQSPCLALDSILTPIPTHMWMMPKPNETSIMVSGVFNGVKKRKIGEEPF